MSLLDDILNKVRQGVQSAGNFVAKDIQRSPIAQQYNAIRQTTATPQFQQQYQQVKNNFVNNPIIKKVSSQPLFSAMSVLPGASIANTPAVRHLSPTIGQYASTIVNPVEQGLSNIFQARTPTQAGLGGLQTATGAFNATPQGLLFNTTRGVVAGGINTARTRQPLTKTIPSGILNPSVGNALFPKSTSLALATDFISGSPKSFIKPVEGVVKGLKGYSPRAFDIHPADQEIMGEFVNQVQTMGGKSTKLDSQLLKDAQNIAEHYIGKSARNASNEKLAQAFDALLASHAKSRGQDVLQTAFPKMGFSNNGKTSDASTITKLKDSINEGNTILRSGSLNGKKLTQEELQTIAKSVENAQRKIGEQTIQYPGQDISHKLQEFSSDELLNIANKGVTAAQLTKEGLKNWKILVKQGKAIYKNGKFSYLPQTKFSVTKQINRPIKPMTPISDSEILQSRSTQTPAVRTQAQIKAEVKGTVGSKINPVINPTSSLNQGSVLKDIQFGFDNANKARVAENKGALGLQARTQLIDRLSPVFDFVNKAGKDVPTEKNPYKQMRLLAGVSGKAETFMTQKLAPILSAEKNRLSDLSSLLVLDRENELLGRGLIRKRTSDQVAQGMSELQAKYGDQGFATLQKSAQDLRNVGSQLLDELKNSGIIDQASYYAIKSKNQFYVPFEAVSHIADNLEKGNFGSGSFNVASQDVIKKIGDYTGDVANPLESLIKKIPKVIGLVEKNKAMQAFVNLRNQYPDIYKDLIIPTKQGTPQSKGIINVFENGNNVRYAVPQVVESAIKNLDSETAGLLGKIGSFQANILRTGATALNIGFIPTNIARDVQDALTTELTERGAKAMFSFLGSYPKAIFEAATKGNLYQEWAASGGLQSTMMEQILKRPSKTIDELAGRRNIFKTVINSPRSLIEFANRVGEQSTRLARFSSGVKRGESTAEAAFKSRDISLDFSKAGNSIKVLNQVIPFLNAGIQGSEKMLRLYKTNPKAAIASTAVVFGTPAVLLNIHNNQFKDYQDIPDAEKQTNWIFITRDRTPEEIAANEKIIGFKMPKGFIGRITANAVESSMDFIRQRDPQALASSLYGIAEGVSPVGFPVDKQSLGKTLSGILPPVLKAGTEAVSNTNLFFGTPIVPQGLQALPSTEQYRPTTPNVYKVAGKVLNQSPLILENTVNTTTGGLGRQIATGLSGDLKGATVDQITRRFNEIRGGAQAEKAYQTVGKEKEYTALRNKQLKEAYASGDMKKVEELSKGMSSQQINSLIRNQNDKMQQKTLSPVDRAFDTLSKEEKARLNQNKPSLQSNVGIVDKAAASENTPVGTIPLNFLKEKIKDTGKAEMLKNGDILYKNVNGNVATISLQLPTKGQGIDAFTNQNWQVNKALEVYKTNLKKDDKEKAYKKLGIDSSQLEYAYKSNKSNDVKTQYAIKQAKTLNHKQLIERMVTGRVKSLTGDIFATDTVLTNLMNTGLLSKAEVTALKKIKLDEKGNPVKGAVRISKGNSKAKRKALLALNSKNSIALSKLFLSNVKNKQPDNVRTLTTLLKARSPKNTGLKNIQDILSKSESLANNRKGKAINSLLLG